MSLESVNFGSVHNGVQELKRCCNIWRGGRLQCAGMPAPCTHLRAFVGRRKTRERGVDWPSPKPRRGGLFIDLRAPNTPPFVFGRRGLLGNTHLSPDHARPRRPKTKGGFGHVLVYTQATPPGFGPPMSLIAAETRESWSGNVSHWPCQPPRSPVSILAQTRNP
jgi:hypothetical protein